MHDQFEYFDAQLDHALMAYGIGRYSRPPTPSEASVGTVGSPQSRTMALRQTRPQTRDSERSSLSRLTVESSMSVLGAAHKVKAQSKANANAHANGAANANASGLAPPAKDDAANGAKRAPGSYRKGNGRSRPGTASTIGKGEAGAHGLDRADSIAARIASISAKVS